MRRRPNLSVMLSTAGLYIPPLPAVSATMMAMRLLSEYRHDRECQTDWRILDDCTIWVYLCRALDQLDLHEVR